MTVALCETPFDPWQALARHQAEALPAGAFGATAVFIGTMRDFSEGRAVGEMFLEHYPGMTERELGALVAECSAHYEVLETLVLHRVGTIAPGEPIVLVAVWSAHRAEAFTVCRAIMEALKSRAPFWKKERSESGEQWVEQNTPGEPARRRDGGAGVD